MVERDGARGPFDGIRVLAASLGGHTSA